MPSLLNRHHPHDPPVGEIPVPHGPVTGQDHEHLPKHRRTTDHERRIFSHITRPSDSYTSEGTYWADLPFRKRLSFVHSVDKEEATREVKTTWSMIKKDPLSPVSWYFRNAVLPGAGLGLEGYVLFSIGNLEPLFSAAWPECWGEEATVCTQNWVASVTYLEIVGIMIGQIGVGIIGDWIGRRWGLIQDALIMFVGLLLLTASWAQSLQGWVIFYAWSLFFYGLGVGGEYPITATSSMEAAVSSDRLSSRDDRLHRGRRVTTAFLMQGWGQFWNQIILLVLLVIFNRHPGSPGSPPYSAFAAQFTFRLSFAIPAVLTLWLVYYRTWKIPRADRELHRAKRRVGVTGYDLTALRACWKHFGGRLVATAGTWFCNDVFFYGNKLFQGRFIAVISSNPKSLSEKWLWNLANVVISLAGYYLASFLIDNKMYGRKTMQQVGFLMCFIMFVIPAFGYDYFTSPGIGIRSFQAMYFLSSFFNQFGPNSVTFLVAAEVFPAPVRASAHGLSACIGKAGALLASVLYNYIDDRTKFHVVPWFGLAGVLLTWLFLPDTTGLDLEEQERRWVFLRKGEGHKYHGVAVHPQHLSAWERMRGVAKSYDPDADLKSRIEEIRSAWQERQTEKAGSVPSAEKASSGDDESGEDDQQITDEIHVYFQELYGKQKEASGGVLVDESPRGEGSGTSHGSVSPEMPPNEKRDL